MLITISRLRTCALRRFPEALATLDRVLAWEPTNADALGAKAGALWATGDLQAVEPLLANPGIDPVLRGDAGFVPAPLCRGHRDILKCSGCQDQTRRAKRDEKLLLALSQQRAGDVAAARATYQSAVQDLQRDLEKVAPDSNHGAGRIPFWVWPMQVWAKQPLLSPKDKKPWPCVPLPKTRSKVPR